MKRLPLTRALVVLFPVALASCSRQPPPKPITEAEIRAVTKEAESEGRGDPDAVLGVLDKKVQAQWGEFELLPIAIVGREDISLYLTTPYMVYRQGVADSLRQKQPTSTVPWSTDAILSLSTMEIGAPDIGKIVVQRDGKEIPPVKNLLRQMDFTLPTGQSSIAHTGEVHFAMSAFAPGATVVITAVPAANSEMFTLTLKESQLERLK